MIRSSFLYGYDVTVETNTFYFDEGGGVLSFTVEAGAYSFTALGEKLALKLNATGSQNYTVTTNRDKRSYIISAPVAFDLLPSAAIQTIFSVIGFAADSLGLASHEGDMTGSLYLPQFPLENYTSFDDYKKPIKGNATEAPSGITKATSFGTNSFMACDIKYITDVMQLSGSPVEGNATGKVDAKAFADYLITKGELEFMFDRENTADFSRCIIEKTKTDKNGLGYRFKELYGRGMPNVFELSGLEFRRIE